MTGPLVLIDTENTSLRPDRLVWEVAMIRRDLDPIRQVESNMFVTGLDLSNADPFSLSVGGYYKRHPEITDCFDEGPFATEADVAFQVERITRGAHLVGSNPAFDAECLAAMLRRHGLIPAWNYHLVDVSVMGLGYLQGIAAREIDIRLQNDDTPPVIDRSKATPPWKSDEIAAACGVEPAAAEERHTALGDARWVMRWYDAITGGAQ